MGQWLASARHCESLNVVQFFARRLGAIEAAATLRSSTDALSTYSSASKTRTADEKR